MSAIEKFIQSSSFAVAGASNDRSKFGNRVLLALAAHGKKVTPLNPTESSIEGVDAYASVLDLPQVPEALSIVTKPHVTLLVTDQAIAAGVKRLWMQPGAQHPEASAKARKAGLEVIDDGSCILVELGKAS